MERRPTTWTSTTFRALAYRDYRYLLLGQISNSAALWMEQIARAALVIDLTGNTAGSAVAVGLVTASRMSPQLIFGLIAGPVADRFNRRLILLAVKWATLILNFMFAFLVVSGQVEVWHLYAFGLIRGVFNSFDQPARQALIPSLVSEANVSNAIALNQGSMNIMRIMAASIAGILLALIHVEGVFLTIGFVSILPVLFTYLMRVPAESARARDRRPMMTSLVEGLRYARDNKVVGGSIALAMAYFVFGMPYMTLFVPLMAKQVLNTGDAGIGYLISVAGLGSLVGAITVASLGQIRRKGLIQVAVVPLFGLALMGFAMSAWQPVLLLTYLALLPVGFLSSWFMSINNTVLLTAAPPEMRGRVMSLFSLDRGVMPVGAIVAGFLSASAGPQMAIIVFGGLCAVMAITVALLVPHVRRTD